MAQANHGTQSGAQKNSEAATAHELQMRHTSLYRKYRPEQWSDVVGQSHIVDILKHEVQKEIPSHAFLFAGSRGTGKTTIARIFARDIGTAPEDIYEIDAASNTGVDDIRTLTEGAHTLPLKSKFKVYILDEVHMLSKSAFNAFLKTLEEPPKHVIFILATTELHKIPETIISRCQIFHFKKPTIEILTQIVIDTGKKEQIQIAPKAAEKIARLGNGSFRDTLSHLQSVLTLFSAQEKNQSTATEITLELLEKHMSTPPDRMVIDWVDIVSGAQINQKNLSAPERLPLALALLDEVQSSDMDVSMFVDLAIAELRNRLLAGSANTKDIIRCIELLLDAKILATKTDIKTLPIELAVFKLFA